jgi:hypothetical protein
VNIQDIENESHSFTEEALNFSGKTPDGKTYEFQLNFFKAVDTEVLFQMVT